MRIQRSYGIEIKHYKRIFDDTLLIYREALKEVIPICNEWYDIWVGKSTKDALTYIEMLIHNTGKNEAKYDFDKKFYKFPSYYRRSVINKAIGIVKSYRSNYSNWEETKQGKPPKLSVNHFAMPVLYNTSGYIRTGEYSAKIKIYHKNDWVWLNINLRKTDVGYITKHIRNCKESCPTLEKRNGKYYLRFLYEHKVELTNTNDIIVSVDLGVNNSATMSAMLRDGTIIGRKIIYMPKEKDRLYTTLNRIKKAQSNGNKSTPRLWAYANSYNRDISEKTAKAIIDFAVLYSADIIVFEALNFQGKLKGSKKQRLHLWRKQEIQNIVTNKAHALSMRISKVCAWNTSKLAFDGSGIVQRYDNNYSICRSQKGKEYHCDLSASYNIGARYFIREILKTLPERERLQVEAKVPQLCTRTRCTLSDLISLNAEIKLLAV